MVVVKYPIQCQENFDIAVFVHFFAQSFPTQWVVKLCLLPLRVDLRKVFLFIPFFQLFHT